MMREFYDMQVTVIRVGEPTRYFPVAHTCGDFEMRRMRPELAQGAGLDADGVLRASNRCTLCDPSRPSNAPAGPFKTLSDALAACQNANEGLAGKHPYREIPPRPGKSAGGAAER